MGQEISNGRTATSAVAAVALAIMMLALGAIIVLRGEVSTGANGVPSARSSPSSSMGSQTSPDTSTAPPATQAPTMPSEAFAATTVGAEAFFRHFLQLYASSYNTLDARGLAEISSPDCKFCSSVVQNVAEAKDQDRTVVAPVVEVVEIVVAPGDASVGLLVSALVNQDPVVTLSSGGEVLGRSEPIVRARLDAKIVWKGNLWQVQAVKIVSKGKSK